MRLLLVVPRALLIRLEMNTQEVDTNQISSDEVIIDSVQGDVGSADDVGVPEDFD